MRSHHSLLAVFCWGGTNRREVINKDPSPRTTEMMTWPRLVGPRPQAPKVKRKEKRPPRVA